MDDFRYTTNTGRQRRPNTTTGATNKDKESRRSASRDKQRRKQPTNIWNQQWMTIVISLATFGVWYLTPVSELIVVQMILPLIPLEADLDLGREVLRKDGDIERRTIHDPYWTPKIRRIGHELVQTASQDLRPFDYDWDFGVLRDSKVVNAFCLPGGVVRITTALLDQLSLTDGELAALLGHEMGHVLHRHAQARILQRRILSTVLQAFVYQDDDDKQETFGEAIGELLLKSADWLGQQSFSRANEYQADETSWELLLSPHNAYHPQAVQSLLSKLWEYHGRQGGITSWDSTHPGTLDRIEALENKWKALTYSERKQVDKRFRVR